MPLWESSAERLDFNNIVKTTRPSKSNVLLKIVGKFPSKLFDRWACSKLKFLLFLLSSVSLTIIARMTPLKHTDRPPDPSECDETTRDVVTSPIYNESMVTLHSSNNDGKYVLVLNW